MTEKLDFTQTEQYAQNGWAGYLPSLIDKYMAKYPEDKKDEDQVFYRALSYEVNDGKITIDSKEYYKSGHITDYWSGQFSAFGIPQKGYQFEDVVSYQGGDYTPSFDSLKPLYNFAEQTDVENFKTFKEIQQPQIDLFNECRVERTKVCDLQEKLAVFQREHKLLTRSPWGKFTDFVDTMRDNITSKVNNFNDRAFNFLDRHLT